MKNDLDYWEKNREHLQKHFLDWEEFVWAEKLSLREKVKSLIFAPFFFALMIGVMLFMSWLMPFLAIYFIFMLLILVISVILEFCAGSYRRKWLILTTRAIYLCYGKNCELIFDWSYSSIAGVSYQNGLKWTYIQLFSKDTAAKSETAYRGVPAKGRMMLLKNHIRRLCQKPLKHKIYSLSVLAGVSSNSSYRTNICCYSFAVPKDSECFHRLMFLTEGFPRIRRMEFPYVTPSNSMQDFLENL